MVSRRLVADCYPHFTPGIQDTAPFGPGGRLLARVTIPETSAPVLGAEQRGPAHRLLWQMVFEGRAAGNHGDLYENRDRGHSRLPAEAHPQLTHVTYDAEMREARLDYGLAGPVSRTPASRAWFFT